MRKNTGNKKQIEKIIQLYLQDKISLGKAVEITGIDRISLMELIRKKDPTLEMYSE